MFFFLGQIVNIMHLSARFVQKNSYKSGLNPESFIFLSWLRVSFREQHVVWMHMRLEKKLALHLKDKSQNFCKKHKQQALAYTPKQRGRQFTKSMPA